MEYVLLVWNGFEEGNEYYLFEAESELGKLAQECHGHHLGLVGSEELDDKLSELSEKLAGAKRLDTPIQLNFNSTSAKVQIVESGYVP